MFELIVDGRLGFHALACEFLREFGTRVLVAFEIRQQVGLQSACSRGSLLQELPVLAQHVLGLVLGLFEGLHLGLDELDLHELGLAGGVGVNEDQLDVLVGHCVFLWGEACLLWTLGPHVLDLEELQPRVVRKDGLLELLDEGDCVRSVLEDVGPAQNVLQQHVRTLAARTGPLVQLLEQFDATALGLLDVGHAELALSAGGLEITRVEDFVPTLAQAELFLVEPVQNLFETLLDFRVERLRVGEAVFEHGDVGLVLEVCVHAREGV